MNDLIKNLTARFPEIAFFVIAYVLSKVLEVEEPIMALILLFFLYIVVKVIQYALANQKSFGFFANVLSFLKNEPPIPFGSKVVTNIQNLLVIGDLSKSKLMESINNRFSPVLGNGYISNCFNNVKTNIDIEDEKRRLSEQLESAKSVIVFRTLYFEKNSWIYETIDIWSKKNTDVPFLFINLTKEEFQHAREQQQLSAIPSKYMYINLEEPGDISLKLLHRAIDRATDWKKLASYNRSIIIFVLLLLFGFTFYYYRLLEDEQNLRTDKAEKHFDICSGEILEQVKSNSYNSQIISNLFELLSKETVNFISEENSPNLENQKIYIDFWSDTVIDGKKILYTISRTNPDKKNTLTIWDSEDTTSFIAFSYNHKNNFSYLSIFPHDSLHMYTRENPEISNARILSHRGNIIDIAFNSRNNEPTILDTVHFLWKSQEPIKEMFHYWSNGNSNIGFSIMNPSLNENSFNNDGTKHALMDLADQLSKIDKNLQLNFSYFLNSSQKINWHDMDKNNPDLYTKIMQLKTK